MRRLPPPATGVETYLAAIHEELRDIRVALVDRGLVRLVDERISEALGEVATAVQAAGVLADDPFTPSVGEPATAAPTKRTRTRTR